VKDQFDRIVRSVLGLAVVSCTAAAIVARPVPLRAPARAVWAEAANGPVSSDHVALHTFAIDVVAAGAASGPYTALPITVVRGTPVRVTGWAYDPRSKRTAKRFLVRTDANPWQRDGSYHLARPDVAAAFNLPDVGDSGFVVVAQTSRLGPGYHRIAFATETDRNPLRPLGATITVFVRNR
jgi:hypothetical protein